jgi:hypothetical protein
LPQTRSLIRVTDAERTALKLNTIGAYDVSKPERLIRRKAKDKAHKQAARRAKGVLPREEYLAKRHANSLSAMQPWKDLGISPERGFGKRR